MAKIIFIGTQAIRITLHSVNLPAVAATGQWEAPVLQENSDDLLWLKLVVLQLRTVVLTCENLGFLTKTDSSNTLILSFVSVYDLDLLCVCVCLQLFPLRIQNLMLLSCFPICYERLYKYMDEHQ